MLETSDPVQADLERFLGLVRRELGADDARVVEAEQEPPDDPSGLRCAMADGRWLTVRFATSPPDKELKLRRLEMLVGSFDAVIDGDTESRPSSRPPVARLLHEELDALCERAMAANAMVIDANSPVEWAAARPQEVIPLETRSSRPPADGNETERRDDRSIAATSRRALHVVRSLPELAALRKGKHMRYVERAGDVPLVAHSFAGIYLLVVVFLTAFDELRAERAILDALPRIERLVLALPPLDPAPYAGVAALRRPRRR
jgi:hypothetical protein